MIQWSFFVLQTLSLTHALAEINLDFSSVVTDIGLGCRQVWSVVMAYYLLYSEALAAIQHNASELTNTITPFALYCLIRWWRPLLFQYPFRRQYNRDLSDGSL